MIWEKLDESKGKLLGKAFYRGWFLPTVGGGSFPKEKVFSQERRRKGYPL